MWNHGNIIPSLKPKQTNLPNNLLNIYTGIDDSKLWTKYICHNFAKESSTYNPYY